MRRLLGWRDVHGSNDGILLGGRRPGLRLDLVVLGTSFVHHAFAFDGKMALKADWVYYVVATLGFDAIIAFWRES